MEVELMRTFRFEAAHKLTGVPEGHKCARLHGHSFKVDITIRGPVDPVTGWLMDFGDIKAIVGPVVDQLDHRYLNDFEGLSNPTSEVLAGWLWERIAPTLPTLAAIRVHETCNAHCTYRGDVG